MFIVSLSYACTTILTGMFYITEGTIFLKNVIVRIRPKIK